MMQAPLILLIETSTRTCSVALTRGSELLQIRESDVENDHAAQITNYISDVLNRSSHRLDELDAVAVSQGPGSYTGLRIGLSTAKGLCYALGKSLIGIPTLEAFAMHCFLKDQQPGKDDLVLSMMDARRMEVFALTFDADRKPIGNAEAIVLDADAFPEMRDRTVYICGDGAAKARALFSDRPNWIWQEDFRVSAELMTLPALKRFQNSEFLDLAYCEPFYLKEYIAGAPKVKGLH